MPTATLIIHIQSRPGQAEALKTRLLELNAPTRDHARCLHFNLHQALEADGLFMWYESWLDRDALAERLLRHPLQELSGELAGMIAGKETMTLWERIR